MSNTFSEHEAKKDALKDWFDEQSDSDLMSLHNSYCESVGYDSDSVYEIGEFFSLFFGSHDILDVIRRLGSDFNSNHNYARMDSYGNVESTSDVTDWVDVHEIITFIISDDDDLGNNDIREILDNFETSEDDE